ncbi:MAG: hypothetical protein IJP95_04635 [Bacteroidales bacterium]|nr:hypothetical protein [Bacteroidales bacterium]
MNRLTYLLKGKTQYNLHSPFVFELYNEVLLPRTNSVQLKSNNLRGLCKRNAALVYKIADHFAITSLFVGGYANGHPFSEWAENVLPNLVASRVLHDDNLKKEGYKNLLICCSIDYYSLYENTLHSMVSNDTIFAITDIHSSKAAEKQWRSVLNNPANKLAIDLFSCGLVFFRKELSTERYVLLV